MKRVKTAFQALEAEWYERLRDDGFEDIEDTTKRRRPLKEWHSFKFLSERSQRRQAVVGEYLELAEDFLHSERFDDACDYVSKSHGNSRVSSKQIRHIWELHVGGATERSIAADVRRSKSCIHYIITKLKEWMTLT